MLRGLAAWLRAAGRDTALAPPGTPDRDVLLAGRAERRRLFTRDRRLAAALPEIPAHLLARQGLDRAAPDLGPAHGIDWQCAPFSRCLVDNAARRPARGTEAGPASPRARRIGGATTICPASGRLYRPGSHVRRMQARLDAWSRAAACDARRGDARAREAAPAR